MPSYDAMLVMLRADLDRFITERNTAQQKIERIAAAIEHIEILAEDLDAPIMQPPPLGDDEEQGFTDRVREILKANPLKRLTAIEIRNVLLEANPDNDPKVTLIHAHNTLKRLHGQDEVRETQIADGRKAYQWIDQNIAAERALGSKIPADHPIHKLAYKMEPPPNSVPINTDGASWKKKK
jgi:hypothetical protein